MLQYKCLTIIRLSERSEAHLNHFLLNLYQACQESKACIWICYCCSFGNFPKTWTIYSPTDATHCSNCVSGIRDNGNGTAEFVCKSDLTL